MGSSELAIWGNSFSCSYTSRSTPPGSWAKEKSCNNHRRQITPVKHAMSHGEHQHKFYEPEVMTQICTLWTHWSVFYQPVQAPAVIQSPHRSLAQLRAPSLSRQERKDVVVTREDRSQFPESSPAPICCLTKRQGEDSAHLLFSSMLLFNLLLESFLRRHHCLGLKSTIDSSTSLEGTVADASLTPGSMLK